MATKKRGTRGAQKKVPEKRRRTPKSSPTAGIHVRMYRQGLGDCFLISLPKKDGGDFHIMIDCGVILGTTNAEGMMQDVVQNIIAATGGRVDILVATHEHWDHLSGFVQAKNLFAVAGKGSEDNRLRIGQVWFAWSEDPNNALARSLREERAQKLNGLRAAAEKMRSLARELGETSSPIANAVEEVLSFFGAAKGPTTGDALNALRGFSESKPRYCRPADKPWTSDNLPGIRIYVLGPPEDETLIRKTSSSTELYQEGSSLALAEAFFAVASSSSGDGKKGQEIRDLYYPFDSSYRIVLGDLKERAGSLAVEDIQNQTVQFFNRYYWGKDPDSLYSDQRWRLIDLDWLNASSEFALQLDNATNNTSLVLAIEMVDSDKVLLFVADAQVGNWLSWQNLSWKLDGDTIVTGPDLLKRTVLYKVGHHGSHNATLKARGLELMESDQLVAFIPVNHEMAVKKHWGKMPLPALVKALQDRTKGRVLRIDQEFEPSEVDESVRSDFQKRVTADKLYFEYVVE